MTATKQSQWSVIVGNIGTVYTGTNGYEAFQVYVCYRAQSVAGYGRASNEIVILWRDDEVYREYIPATELED